ncbi:isopenicillin N synthase family dioxygenase [Pseudidiomarina andamanensis]|uniref:2-oxoglutarate-dependent ethylene/succinate-forming enzyme n=1 Tax=Pseudidiomarina andamanensis TaxID=1940690 RepID=A0AA92EUD5_9GAMM|nr:2-oxoglutarate and iron-dependent oxygenase domain-containing protein [Pseudidiomarina andamanensis]MDS0219011.1 isopenicillin N synthase family oxygenase [Pseudidiomarina andamanensis]QGT96365.1 isopenicillin N synthase family oxygenase [Pseudidiomarina andamanensis]
MNAATLPIISLTSLDSDEGLAQLRRAASEVGFFYLIDHGLSDDAQQEYLALSRAFFQLPAEEKQRVDMIHSPHFRGYNAMGNEMTAGRLDAREQFDWMNEELALSAEQLNHPWQKLIGPNLWPSAMPILKPALTTLQNKLSDITVNLLQRLCESLGVDGHALDHTIGTQPYTHAKLIRYPAQASPQQGVGAHKDPGYLTLVMQDAQSGLKVERGDAWVGVPPIAGALVVNIGELLELASNGYLKATNHKVESPIQSAERYSIAFFMAAQLSATVPVLSLPPELKSRALGPSVDPSNPLMTDVGNNVLKGRLRSHPHVTRKHYCDEPLRHLLAKSFAHMPTADICDECRL